MWATRFRRRSWRPLLYDLRSPAAPPGPSRPLPAGGHRGHLAPAAFPRRRSAAGDRARGDRSAVQSMDLVVGRGPRAARLPRALESSHLPSARRDLHLLGAAAPARGRPLASLVDGGSAGRDLQPGDPVHPGLQRSRHPEPGEGARRAARRGPPGGARRRHPPLHREGPGGAPRAPPLRHDLGARGPGSLREGRRVAARRAGGPVVRRAVPRGPADGAPEPSFSSPGGARGAGGAEVPRPSARQARRPGDPRGHGALAHRRHGPLLP